MDQKSFPLTVYFDGSCPLCRREIGFYQKRRGAERIDWVDLAEDAPEALACKLGTDLTCEQAMARFHVRLGDNTLKDGAAGFVALWKELPSFRWLGHVIGFAPILWVTEHLYTLFLKIRPQMQSIAARAEDPARHPAE